MYDSGRLVLERMDIQPDTTEQFKKIVVALHYLGCCAEESVLLGMIDWLGGRVGHCQHLPEDIQLHQKTVCILLLVSIFSQYGTAKAI